MTYCHSGTGEVQILKPDYKLKFSFPNPRDDMTALTSLSVLKNRCVQIVWFTREIYDTFLFLISSISYHL